MHKQNILIKTKESRFIYYALNTDAIIEKFEETAQKIRSIVNNC